MPARYLNDACLRALSSLAVDAGRAIMEIYNTPEGWDVEMKADDSPLTQADLQANDIIVTGLTKLAPDIPVLSEESPWCGGQAATYWAVDPLDGTKEFIKRNGEFTVNIALVIDGVARMGVIYAPALKTLWAGISREAGATSGTSPSWAGRLELTDACVAGLAVPKTTAWTAIATSAEPRAAGEKLRLLGSRSHGGEAFPGWLSEQLRETDIAECGSSLKFCLIAQGDADVYVRMNPTCIWDTAAGQAILAAAGGKVLQLTTKTDLAYPDPGRVLNASFVAYALRRIEQISLITMINPEKDCR
jgi:3'(2'), 5'-bisphosphate nucleotidase